MIKPIISHVGSDYCIDKYFPIQAPSKKKIEINTIASNYHLEVNPR